MAGVPKMAAALIRAMFIKIDQENNLFATDSGEVILERLLEKRVPPDGRRTGAGR